MCVTERGGGKGADTYQVHIGQGSLRTTFRPSDQHLNATNPFNPCGSIEKEHPLGQLGKLSSGTRSAVSSLAGALFPAHRLSNKAVSIPGHFGGWGGRMLRMEATVGAASPTQQEAPRLPHPHPSPSCPAGWGGREAGHRNEVPKASSGRLSKSDTARTAWGRKVCSRCPRLQRSGHVLGSGPILGTLFPPYPSFHGVCVPGPNPPPLGAGTPGN